MKTKKIYFPEKSNSYYVLCHKCMQEEKYIDAIHFCKKSLEICKNKQEKKESLMCLAALYSKIGQIKFANEALFELLCEFPNYHEAHLALMFNLPLTANGKQLGEYYLKKCQDIFEKFVVDLDDLESDEFGDIIDDENEILDDFFEKCEMKKKFQIVNKKSKLKQYVSDAYQALAHKHIDEALEFLMDALTIRNASNEGKMQVCNAFSCCYFEQDERELCYESLMLSFEVQPNNIDCLCLMIAFARRYDDDKTLQFAIENLEKCKIDNSYDAFKAISSLNGEKRFAKALEFTNEVLNTRPYDYIFNKCRAILQFNLGNISCAKRIFIRQNRLYGDFCDAKHFLTFFEVFSSQKYLPIQRLVSDFNLMTSFYISKATIYLSLPQELAKKNFEEKSFRNCLDWLLEQYINVELTTNIIKELIAINEKTMINWLLKKLCQDDGVDVNFKIEIVVQMLLSGYTKAIQFVFATKIDSLKFSRSEELAMLSPEIFEGYCRAYVIAIFSEMEATKPLSKALKLYQNKISENKIDAKFDSQQICAILLKIAFDDLLMCEMHCANFDKKVLNDALVQLGL